MKLAAAVALSPALVGLDPEPYAETIKLMPTAAYSALMAARVVAFSWAQIAAVL